MSLKNEKFHTKDNYSFWKLQSPNPCSLLTIVLFSDWHLVQEETTTDDTECPIFTVQLGFKTLKFDQTMLDHIVYLKEISETLVKVIESIAENPAQLVSDGRVRDETATIFDKISRLMTSASEFEEGRVFCERELEIKKFDDLVKERGFDLSNH